MLEYRKKKILCQWKNGNVKNSNEYQPTSRRINLYPTIPAITWGRLQGMGFLETRQQTTNFRLVMRPK
jgi:hypothetical protein